MEYLYVFSEYLCHNRSEHTSEESNNYDYSCQYQNFPLGPVRLHSNWFHYGHISEREQLIIAMNWLNSLKIKTKVRSNNIKTFHQGSRLYANWFHFGHVSVDYHSELVKECNYYDYRWQYQILSFNQYVFSLVSLSLGFGPVVCIKGNDNGINRKVIPLWLCYCYNTFWNM